ncbi:peptidylprolyl isomerase [Marichromatium gracile]|uniref:peptidylprolyl isomerase n=1 Tax=Marichromatium TaxID=85076 RepID=UPI000F3CDED0|nr:MULTISPECIES: peptidylprolyl isomerase [Marichromatium]MBO8087071.1 peptidylprolyl isomerase [Marichromatium sp.]MCF1182635.1 peptidylprolyl isomerase [Marichromatium gracile]RNE91461.1 peptidylprolyl isomerase [Marichromatium sp. AB31]RNE92827.1 peptidylprolyl isomerase [Marichromatium sp. AB32]
MKRSTLSLLVCALLAAGPGSALAEPDADTVIATVNGVEYPLDLFRLFYVERLQQNPEADTQAVQQRAFDEFMNLVVASQEAERRDLDDSREVAMALELQRMKVLSSAALGAMAEDIEPTDKALKEAYDQVVERAARTEYKARHILVKDEATAKKLIKQLDKGADFAELAKEHSLGPTGKNGGELDWFDAGQMVAPFAEAVAEMKPGSHSEKPVQTQFGWHVIELQETRKAEPPSFEDAKPQLSAMLKRRALGEQLTEMRDGAMVELNEEIVTVTPKED